MKSIVLTVFVFFLSLISCKDSNQSSFIYWEDMTKTEQERVLCSSKICKNAVKYYQGTFRVSDDKLTEKFLTRISSAGNSNQEKAFYFHIFNQICLKSDASLSEILGEYCMKFILRMPKITLSYFQRNVKIEKVYSLFLGSEFFFIEEGSSDLRYSYEDFKQILESKVKKNQKYKKSLLMFYKDLESAMKEMNE
jgi:hypothetical protein